MDNIPNMAILRLTKRSMLSLVVGLVVAQLGCAGIPRTDLSLSFTHGPDFRFALSLDPPQVVSNAVRKSTD